MQHIAITFVDNADFCTGGEDHEENMQQIMDPCTKLHETTGCKTQQDKMTFIVWHGDVAMEKR